ncbi:MAG: hypothetical protein HKL95_11310, partial [Phycisphaerae bacterium]|nr:hypothetical protein [Phycisphaerae bacterium]
ICVCITGNGLKTTEVVADQLVMPTSIPPKLEAFDAFIAELDGVGGTRELEPLAAGSPTP